MGFALACRRFGKSAAMSAADFAGDGPLVLLDFGVRAVRVAVLLGLWRMVLGRPGVETPMTLDTVLTYTLISEVFSAQLYARTGIVQAFWQGTIVMHYLRPQGLVAQFGAEMVGRWLPGLALFSLPLLLLAPLLGVDPRPHDGAALLAFALSLGLAVSAGMAIDFIAQAITVALDQPVWLIEFARSAITGLLSGAVIPLALLPWGLGAWFEWLPFASQAWAPLALYTGVGSAARLLALQAFWSALLWPLALWMWRANREKVVGYGG